MAEETTIVKENTKTSITPPELDFLDVEQVKQPESILLTNIGNSNLRHRGKEIPKEFFRTLTKQYSEDLPLHEKDLEIQILQNHLEGIKKVYLFATDQEDEKHNAQDTYYAAVILKVLINKQYRIPVEIIRLKGNPTDENNVVARYAPVIRKIIELNPHAHLNYNLAGGTSQMKTVMRELISYQLPPSRRTARYSDRQDQVSEVQRQYVERYILLKMAREFVHKYEYSAALDILKKMPAGGKANPELSTAIQIARLRKEFNLSDATKLLPKAENLAPVFINYLNAAPSAIPDKINSL
ncbi:MAG: hypothetical protein LPJ89_08370, partial [Hymenobacteraceae bacterium]|nr:hypothetical protein [Hymenobacteraceae bacterium]MDX5443779.1 hypothetical protein [Hymenobacteraceae bacterium]MDX5512890.1 hypothetical protein [Hymenobacteraceae bacterium]